MIIMGNKNNEDIAKPFVKWVGGKSQLIKIFDSKFPREIREIKKYFEPFIGGGALFFYLMSNYDNIAKAYISDTNEDLILTYRVIKESHEDLILKLDGLIDEWPDTHNSRRPIYERIREEFNKTKSIIDYNRNKNFDEVDILQAARLIFLNKTCFNGIYRVNSKGEFNVPMGRYKNPSFYDENNLKNVSACLQKTEIYNKSYDFFRNMIDEDSFVYLDPPYRPITETSFTSYTKSNFNDDDQKKLARFYRRISKNSKVMLSNYDTKNRDEHDFFFDELYRGFRIDKIPAKRFVNRDGSNRGPINEILVRNYGYEISKQAFVKNKLF